MANEILETSNDTTNTPDAGIDQPQPDVAAIAAQIEGQAAAEVASEIKAEEKAESEVVLTPAQKARAAAEAALKAAQELLAAADEDLWLESTQSDHDKYLVEYTPAEDAWHKAEADYDALFEKYCAKAYAKVQERRSLLDDIMTRNPRSKPAEAPKAEAKPRTPRAPKVDNGQNGAQSSEAVDQEYIAFLSPAQFELVKSHPKFTSGTTVVNGKHPVAYMIHSRPRDLNYYAKHILKAALGTTWTEDTTFKAK